jgi:hypothetical protein
MSPSARKELEGKKKEAAEARKASGKHKSEEKGGVISASGTNYVPRDKTESRMREGWGPRRDRFEDLPREKEDTVKEKEKDLKEARTVSTGEEEEIRKNKVKAEEEDEEDDEPKPPPKKIPVFFLDEAHKVRYSLSLNSA